MHVVYRFQVHTYNLQHMNLIYSQTPPPVNYVSHRLEGPDPGSFVCRCEEKWTDHSQILYPRRYPNPNPWLQAFQNTPPLHSPPPPCGDVFSVSPFLWENLFKPVKNVLHGTTTGTAVVTDKRHPFTPIHTHSHPFAPIYTHLFQKQKERVSQWSCEVQNGMWIVWRSSLSHYGGIERRWDAVSWSDYAGQELMSNCRHLHPDLCRGIGYTGTFRDF